MGRRRSNILQDIFRIGGILPWWQTGLLALGMYAVLHYFAVSDPVVAADPEEALGTLFPNAFRHVAVYAQYIVPWVLIVGMLMSVLRRATRAQLFPSVLDRHGPRDLDELHGDRLEEPLPEVSTELGCPRCYGRMVRRTAKRGRNARNDYWACSRFPACHGTRELEAQERYSLSA